MNNRAEIEDNSIRLLKRQGLWSLDLQSKVRAMDDMDLRAFEEKMKRWNRENPHPITARQEALAVCFLIADSTKEVGRLLKMKPNATKAAKKRLIQKFRKAYPAFSFKAACLCVATGTYPGDVYDKFFRWNGPAVSEIELQAIKECMEPNSIINIQVSPNLASA